MFNFQLVCNIIPFFCLISTTCSSQKLQVDVDYGWQKVDMTWSISKKNQPYKISELEWKKIKSSRYNLSADYQLSNHLIIGSNISFSKTYSGSVRDIDYSEYEPYGIISDQQYSSQKGTSDEISLYANYLLATSKDHKSFFGTTVGLYTHDQKFFLLGTVYQQDDLNSSYKNKWIGGLFGFNGKLALGRIAFTEKVNLGLLIYQAKANWNLIDEFSQPDSFKHNAKGYMYSSTSAISLRLSKKISALYRFSIKSMKTWNGEDILFYKNGTTSSSQLNAVNQLEINNTFGLSLIFDGTKR